MADDAEPDETGALLPLLFDVLGGTGAHLDVDIKDEAARKSFLAVTRNGG